MTVDEFIERWRKSNAAERANYQSFLNELTVLICASLPEPTTGDPAKDAYVYERSVTDPISGTTKFIDLYKRGCFVLEAKQGAEKKIKPSDPLQQELLTGEALPHVTKTGTAVRGTPGWAKAMAAAKQQAWNYARCLDASEGWPPFLMVVDVGHVIELYADFSGAGKNYTQFQDGGRFRIELDDLRNSDVREILRLVWTDPHELDPAKKSAKVTRKIADQLAELGKSFETQGHASELVARFLMRCLFTMFAEDVELIPEGSFTNLLREMRGKPQAVQKTLEELWAKMNTGGFSGVLRSDLLRFNGGLFAESAALPINNMQLGLLVAAAEADWREVEPAIFGTLLERALSPKERHKLGAHYTPRAYVERLVTPTIVEPLRADWDAAKAAAFSLADKGDMKSARETVRDFHHKLCTTRVLDPACGSGNFLYVSMEQMKRLEGEVVDTLNELGDKEARLALAGETVDPHQFLGIELNPWAAAVAELVLWIGYLQWHFRTFGKATPAEPVLKDFHNIECRDALLSLTNQRVVLNDDGEAVTLWDGQSYTTNPVTGNRMPDVSIRVPVFSFDSAKISVWPRAEFIVGNPPFLGNKKMRDALSSAYIDVLHDLYPSELHGADFVMFWWHRCAEELQKKSKDVVLRRFGLITTDSIRQISNRKIVEKYLSSRTSAISIVFAVQEHPWVDSKDGADVEISLTTSKKGREDGVLLKTLSKSLKDDRSGEFDITFAQHRGRILQDLRIGPDVSKAKPLKANTGLCFMGIIPVHKDGFLVSEQLLSSFGFSEPYPNVIRKYLGGNALKKGERPQLIINLSDLTLETALQEFPSLTQKLMDDVKPLRDASAGRSADNDKYAEEWWRYGKSRPEFRAATTNLKRYIATIETSKHRTFSFLESEILPDQKIRAIASDDAALLAILSSKCHVLWATTAGGELGPTPVYNNTVCFDPYPFPVLIDKQVKPLQILGERLDAHRKKQQTLYPRLTLTDMYNVFEKLREIERSRSGGTLNKKEKEIYDQGQIGLLKDIHREIDSLVYDAYGWPHNLNDEEILERLVVLNRERAREEAEGKIRWLRAEYQNPSGAESKAKASELTLEDASAILGKRPWPKELPQQMADVREVLTDLGTASVEEVRREFKRGQTKTIRERLETLAALGQAERISDGRYAG